MSKSWRERCLSNPDIMFKKAFQKAKSRAKRKNIPFEITNQGIIQLFETQKGMCYYSGIKLNIIKDNPDQLHDPFKMSLDCINSDLGYVEGNVVWCAYCVNSMKQRMTAEELVKVCTAVASFFKGKSNNK